MHVASQSLQFTGVMVCSGQVGLFTRTRSVVLVNNNESRLRSATPTLWLCWLPRRVHVDLVFATRMADKLVINTPHNPTVVRGAPQRPLGRLANEEHRSLKTLLQGQTVHAGRRDISDLRCVL